MAKTSRLLPRGAGDRAWLYLLERGDGVIKVGFTRSPHSRLLQHKHAARSRGGLVRFHLFGAIHRLQIIAAEKRAVVALAQAGQQVGSTEEFRGLSFCDALAAIRAIGA